MNVNEVQVKAFDLLSLTADLKVISEQVECLGRICIRLNKQEILVSTYFKGISVASAREVLGLHKSTYDCWSTSTGGEAKRDMLAWISTEWLPAECVFAMSVMELAKRTK